MITLISVIIILLFSLLLALRSVKSELSVPSEVRSLKISRKKGLSGVILFLKKKIVHYCSGSSNDTG